MDDSQSSPENIIASNSSRVRPKKAFLIGVIAVVVVVAVVAAVVVFLVNKQGNNSGRPGPSGSSSSSQAASSDDPTVLNGLDAEAIADISAARESAMNYQLDIIKRMTSSANDEFGFEQAKDEYAKKVDSLSGVAQLYYGIRYSEFYFVWGHSKDTVNTVLNEAVKIAQKYEPLATNDIVKVDYLVNLQNLYTNAGKTTEAEVYRREVEKLTTNSQDGEG